jgi:hypothetical protein
MTDRTGRKLALAGVLAILIMLLTLGLAWSFAQQGTP